MSLNGQPPPAAVLVEFAEQPGLPGSWYDSNLHERDAMTGF